MLRIKQFLQDWVVLVWAMITALFGVNDALDLFAPSRLDRWFLLISFAVFVIIVMWRLMSLRSRLDDYEAKVRLIAKPSFISWKHLDSDPAKVRLETRIEWEIWTDIDINTAKIGLNMIGFRRMKWWQIWRLFQSREEKVRVLPPKGQDNCQYRKKFRATDSQPIEDSAEFEEYEGPWDGALDLELVLETGSPIGKYAADVDPRIWERGSREPL